MKRIVTLNKGDLIIVLYQNITAIIYIYKMLHFPSNILLVRIRFNRWPSKENFTMASISPFQNFPDLTFRWFYRETYHEYQTGYNQIGSVTCIDFSGMIRFATNLTFTGTLML